MICQAGYEDTTGIDAIVNRDPTQWCTNEVVLGPLAVTRIPDGSSGRGGVEEAGRKRRRRRGGTKA